MYYTIRAAKNKGVDQTVQADPLLFAYCINIFSHDATHIVDCTIKLSYCIVYENTIQIIVVLNIFCELKKNLLVLSVCFRTQLLKM